MAQFTHSLCEEVIRTDGKCGMTRNEMVQMARLALRVLKPADATVTEELRWVSVEDRLPPVTQLVMVNTKEMGPLFADRTTSNPQRGWSCIGTVTHWMPIPAIPSPQGMPK